METVRKIEMCSPVEVIKYKKCRKRCMLVFIAYALMFVAAAQTLTMRGIITKQTTLIDQQQAKIIKYENQMLPLQRICNGIDTPDTASQEYVKWLWNYHEKYN